MNSSESIKNNFIGYEYRDVTIDRSMESVYIDGYQNFGWTLDNTSSSQLGLNNITLKFKRDRKLRNKAELTRLQRQFDACVNEIHTMEKSKPGTASVVAYMIGLVGSAFLAGATFAFLGGLIALCIVLAIPGFIGWILPYFLYRSTFTKKAVTVDPMIDQKYDEIYDISKRANDLLDD